MKILNLITLSSALALLLSGCNGSTPTPPEDAIDTSLPVISINGHMEDMKSIAFEWKDVKDPRVTGIYVYRNDPQKDDSQITRYATLDNRFATHYEDNGVVPNTKYQYFFTTFSDKAQSQKSNTLSVSSLPVLPSVAWIDSIQNMPKSVKILWRPHTDLRVNSYILERKSLADDDFKEIAHINGRLNAEYIDNNLNNGQIYKYRIRAVTFDNVESTPSQVVQAVTKLLPPDIQGLTVSNNLPKKIKLSWQPSSVSDFAYYKLYRGESATGTLDYHGKLITNSFTDDVQDDGKQYFYRVTAVDKDGLEGDTSIPALQGITLAKPKTPDMMEAKIVNNKAELRWISSDRRIKSYTLIKTARKGWFDSNVDEIRSITDTRFTDPNVYAGTVYKYQVMGVDENNISSEPSTEATISSDALPIQGEQKRVLQNNLQNTQISKPVVTTPTPEPVKSTVEAAPDLDTGSL